MRPPDSLLALSRWTMPALLGATLVITAVPAANVHGVAEVLRAAAIVAGCREPDVEIRGDAEGSEITVTCKAMTGEP